MDRVVGHDCPIDNKEEMKMEAVIIEDFSGDSTEVSTSVYYDGIVSIDIDLDNLGDGCTIAHYTPEAARKLAAALILAADEAELPVGQGKKVKADFAVADELTKNSKFR